MIKLSIIIPTFNYGNKISSCLDSLIKQDLKSMEILVIDDGSTDDTKLTVERFISKDHRIKYFYKNNSGLSNTRNFGIDKSSGKYIFFIDSDDYIINKKDIFSKLINIMDKDQLDILETNYWINENSKMRKGIGNKKSTEVINSIRLSTYLCNNYVSHCIYRKDVIITNNLLFEPNRYIEDILFYMNFIFLQKRAKYIDIPIFVYNIHANSIMSNDLLKEKRIKDWMFILVKIKQIVLENKASLTNHEYKQLMIYINKSFLKAIVDVKTYENMDIKIKDYKLFFKKDKTLDLIDKIRYLIIFYTPLRFQRLIKLYE